CNGLINLHLHGVSSVGRWEGPSFPKSPDTYIGTFGEVASQCGMPPDHVLGVDVVQCLQEGIHKGERGQYAERGMIMAQKRLDSVDMPISFRDSHFSHSVDQIVHHSASHVEVGLLRVE